MRINPSSRPIYSVPRYDDDASFYLCVCLDRQAVLVSPSKIKVSDVGTDVVEDLDFSGGRVVEMSLGFGHLVAATQNQVHEANH